MWIEIENKLNDLPQMIKDITKDAVTKVSYAIEAKAKENCPTGTGMLRRSIATQIEEMDNGFTGSVGSNVEYAPYVHEGTGIYSRTGLGRKEVPWRFYDAAKGEFVSTSGIKPTPFLSDALEEVAANIGDYV